ncbi:MAG: DUF1893 domain-containing protein [Candidatus Merdivicinus sp.]
MNQNLIDLIDRGEYSCAAMGQEIDYHCSGLGVKPIITPMRENRRFFEQKEVADTVVGKAAALLLVLSGASAVYGKVMSQSAVQVFQTYNVPYQYGTLVDYIQNRTGDGMCPLEDSVRDVSDPEIAWEKIEQRIAQLMAK